MLPKEIKGTVWRKPPEQRGLFLSLSLSLSLSLTLTHTLETPSHHLYVLLSVYQSSTVFVCHLCIQITACLVHTHTKIITETPCGKDLWPSETRSPAITLGHLSPWLIMAPTQGAGGVLDLVR
jgi:hypothetical protein